VKARPLLALLLGRNTVTADDPTFSGQSRADRARIESILHSIPTFVEDEAHLL
jgi:hypothetical protein